MLRLAAFEQLVLRGSIREAVFDKRIGNVIVGDYRTTDGRIARYQVSYEDDQERRLLTLVLDHHVITRVRQGGLFSAVTPR